MKTTPKKPVVKPPPPKSSPVAPYAKEKHKPRFVNYANKPAPKGVKNKVKKAEPMSEALHKLYERLDDWQYAGPLPYDTKYNGTPDPYPMPEFDKRKKTND